MPVRVLMIDDDPQLAELLAAYLRPHDVLLTNAPDGVRGLKALEGGGFDAVVLDVMMPGLDGPMVARRVREAAGAPPPKIVLWSALDHGDLQARAKDCGADAVVLKIAGPAALVQEVGELLDLWQS